MRLLIMMTLGGLLMACAAQSGRMSASGPVSLADLAGPSWVLTSWDGDPARPVALDLDADGRLSGFSGCNRFTGSARLEGDRLVLDGPMATTRMACLDSAASAMEQRILALLESGPVVRFDGAGRLTLSNPQGQDGLVFSPRP